MKDRLNLVRYGGVILNSDFKMIKFLKKYEFWVLIILAIAMYLSESLFGIDGLHDVGTVFFLIAIISLSMKKFMNKNSGE